MSDESVPALETLMQQAYEQLTAGRFDEAAEIFSTALMVEPREARALRGRGVARLRLKQWAQAAEDFRAARDVMPDEPDNWVDLGISLSMTHQMYPAIEVFETFLAKRPDYVRGHLELGLLYLRIGVIPKARTQLACALANRPTLEQRRLIESILREQDTLDRKRFYRPDFEALHQSHVGQAPRAWTTRLREFITRLRGHAPQ